MSHSRLLSCKYCTQRVEVCRGTHLRFVNIVYIAEDASRSPSPDMFYVSVSCLAQVFLSPQAEESRSMSSVQELCTNADSECFSDKSLSPNWTTNPHQSDSDRCRSKYDSKITMFTSENVHCDAIQLFCTSKNPEILHWNSAGAAKKQCNKWSVAMRCVRIHACCTRNNIKNSWKEVLHVHRCPRRPLRLGTEIGLKF